MTADTDNSSRLTRIRTLLNLCPETRVMMAEAGEMLIHHAVLEQHQAGSLLWRQGVPPVDVFVTTGPVRISILDGRGGLLPSILVGDSHVLGEAEVFAGLATRPNEVCVLVPQDVLRIPANEFLQCVEGSPAISLAWLRFSNQRFMLTARHARLLAQRSAEERLQAVLKLLLLYIPADTDGAVTLPFSQEVIGSVAALTRQATAKVMADWRSRGLVDTGYQYLTILQPLHFKG